MPAPGTRRDGTPAGPSAGGRVCETGGVERRVRGFGRGMRVWTTGAAGLSKGCRRWKKQGGRGADQQNLNSARLPFNAACGTLWTRVPPPQSYVQSPALVPRGGYRTIWGESIDEAG